MTPRSSRLVRIGLVLVALFDVVPGAWASAAPRSFFAHFPGAGHAWVAVDGPYNEHLVRDVGQFFLGFAILFAIAALVADHHLVRGALGAALLPSALHLIYHLAHLHLLKGADAVGNAASLTIALLLPAALLIIDLRDAPRQSGGAVHRDVLG